MRHHHETKRVPHRQKTGHYYIYRRKRGLEFFCLADSSSENIPLRTTKLELQAAGLRRKKIALGSKDNTVTAKEKLEDAFPKLEGEGGFE